MTPVSLAAPLLGILSGPAAAQQSSDAPTGIRGAVQSLNPDISVIADVAGAVFTADDPLQSGGHDPTENGFNLQQLELSIESTVDPYFELDANIVFSLYGVEVEEVYATSRGLPGRTQLRVGQMLTNFGRLNNSHPHSWDFVDQPLALGRVFGGEGNRGLGLEGSILLPLPWYVELVASETMAAGASTAKSFYGAQDLGVDSPLHLQTTAAVKQFFPLGDDLSLKWGLSWAGGPNPTGRSNRSEVYGTDVYLKYRPISRGSNAFVALQAEVLHRRYQVPGDVLADWSTYEQLVWRLSRRWGVAARHEVLLATTDGDGNVVADPVDAWQVDDRHRISANTTFWPTEFSRIRLQGATDLRGWEDQPEYSAFLAFEFNVGAHGAHTF